MAVTFPAEGATGRKVYQYDTFLGVDFSKASTNVRPEFSPDSLNMIRDEYGKVRRRMGYEQLYSLEGRIWGLTEFQGDLVAHAGTRLVKIAAGGNQVLFSALAERPSFFHKTGDKLYILDGGGLYAYDGESCESVPGTVPRVLIAGAPSGGGAQFEQVNLLSDQWEQSFRGDGQTKVYQLAFTGLDQGEVVVKTASLSGGEVVWNTMSTTSYTVNRTAGTVTFQTAPGAPVLAQEDNVIIRASKDRSEARSRITGCLARLPFGVDGYDNQLFLTGNPDYPGYLFWSGQGDPAFFGDLQYAVLGQDDSAIVSLSAFGSYLACHKDVKSGKTYLLSVYLERLNDLLTPMVKVAKVVGGSGCVCPYGSQNFGEPVFVTNLGVQALTYRDFTSSEMETLRGGRFGDRLLSEPGLEEAVSCVYKYFYLLAINGHVYVLDRLNPASDTGVLSGAYQYNAYFWDHVPAVCFYVSGDDLYFGTGDGKIMRFFKDPDATASYNDGGEAYGWRWEFPECVGDLFYRKKTIKYLALRAKANVRTQVAVDVRLRGQWVVVLEAEDVFGYLDLDDLDLSSLILDTDATPKKVWQNRTDRGLDKFAFRVRGAGTGKPFGLYSFAFELKERGKHKG